MEKQSEGTTDKNEESIDNSDSSSEIDLTTMNDTDLSIPSSNIEGSVISNAQQSVDFDSKIPSADLEEPKVEELKQEETSPKNNR